MKTANGWRVDGDGDRPHVRGNDPDRRTARASDFVDGRHPGTVTDAAGHATTVEYDLRFGVPDLGTQQ